MKKLLLGLALLTMLTGCQQSNNTNIESPSINEITTYKEIIKDGKVEIDGISYDIQSVQKISNTYDNNGNVVEIVSKIDESEMRVEFLYKNNQIIEEKRYSNDKLTFTTYYHYEDDLLLRHNIVSKSGLENRTEYSYGDKTRTQTHYNSDGSIAYIGTEYLDEDGKMLKGVITIADGEVTDTTTMYYENDLLVKSIRKRDDGAIITFNKEYNNLGDKIMDYNIFSIGKENRLIANFYDIEYNEQLLPETVTIYHVQSQIKSEDIREYE
ncbi:hypothetical protein [Alkaliphilus peptidifermentans]|nr:hypothetical protein [Alkaliphilus peptidifermentans]